MLRATRQRFQQEIERFARSSRRSRVRDPKDVARYRQECTSGDRIDMIDFDRSCNINLRAMATGRKLQLVPPEAARQARQIQTVPARWPFQWPNLIIELNQQSQDYDPHGWLPSNEVPTAERLRATLEQGQLIH